ncbi:serine/threonine-protein kinase [Nocardioides sp.]|uniref:serine/threonine-protein kinase n=1 Tax=Nocardioides sp. TaxID=35761 RepID=UPI00356B07C5
MNRPIRTPAAGSALPSTGQGYAGGQVGDYTLVAKIGEGGMGVVHLARRGSDGHRVALKVLRPHIVGDDEARARLAREVASLSRIRSRWVAEIVDADPWGPVPYVATRYVPGLSLHDHVREEGPLVGDDLLWFAAGLAHGVASVHEVGVLHRDVKPSNVLLEGRAPILIDFGLARVADDPRLTHTGWLLGTPGYLAPEILYGEDATTASDVHSWAATVAYAATGRPPFGRGPSIAIMDRVRRGEHNLSGISEPLRAVLTQALHPEPHQRPTLTEIRVLSGSLSGMNDGAEEFDETTDQTLPYLLAALPRSDEPTDDLSEVPESTRVLSEEPTLTDWDDDALDPWAENWFDPTPEPRAPWPQRLRRAGLLASLGLASGAAVAAAPWAGLVTLILLTWVLRSGSLAVSAAGHRRQLRGRKWYDGVQFLLGTPWDLVRSIPGTLVLLLWSLGLAVAAALLCYAFLAGETVTLAVCGAVLGVAIWSGPGGARVRGPLARVVHPLSRTPGRWALAIGVVLACCLVAAWVVANAGSDWVPGDGRPLSGQVAGQEPSVHGTIGV